MSMYYEHRRASWRLRLRGDATRAELVYHGVIFPACQLRAEWECDHAHRTRGMAQACAETEFDRRTRAEHADTRHHLGEITNPATGEKY